MIASAIRELAISRDARWVAAAFFEKVVQLWDLRATKAVAEVKTGFMFGAKMLKVHPNGGSFMAGNASTGRLDAYAIPSGRQLWRVKLPFFPRDVRYCGLGDYVWLRARDRKSRHSVARVSTANGSVVELIKGIGQYLEGPGGRVLLVPPGEEGPYALHDGTRESSVERLTFALMDTAFGADSVCLTESTGPVRCVDYETGRVRWRFDPEPGSHVLNLHYSERAGAYYGNLRHYESNLYHRVLRFSPQTGECEAVCELASRGAWEVAFSAADRLVTSSGYVIDLTTGKTISKLAFPQREYHPDS